MPRRHFVLFALLCFILTAHAQEPSNPTETARQLAASANDSATTLQVRQVALTNLTEAARLFLSAGEKLEAARVLNRAGRLQLILNAADKADKAIASHTQALALLQEAPSVEVEVDNLNGLAAAHLTKVDKSAVKPALDRSIRLSEQSSYVRGKAQALLILSRLQNLDNHRVALATAQESLALWTTVGDQPGIASSYEQIGDYYFAQNILPESAQSYEQALQIWRNLGNASGQSGALVHLGYIDLRRAEWQSGMSRFFEARALIAETAEPERMGQISCGMAELYNEHGMPEQGLTYYQQALNYYGQVQNAHAIWYATWGLGWSYYLQREYSEALAKFQDSLSFLGDDDDAQKAQTQEHMGMVYLETNEYTAALQSLELALSVFQRTENPMETARVQGLIGNVFERQGQLARSRNHYLKSLKIAERISDPVIKATIDHALGRIALKGGNNKEAEDFLLRSIATTEELKGVSTIRDLRTAFNGSVHDRYQTYIELLMSKAQAAPAGSFAVQAFEASESARARALAEFFHSTHASLAPGIDQELAQKENSLRQSRTQRSHYRSKLLGMTTVNTEELGVVNAELSQLDAEYNEVIATIGRRFPAYKQITQPTAWSLQRIQQEVIENDRTVLVEYSLGEEKSYAWAVTRNSIKVFELPARAVIDDAAKKFSTLLEPQPVADGENKLSEAAQALSQMVLAPLATELNKPVIIVAADGGLNYVPFQALPLPAGNEPLVSRFEIINAPSASILGDLRQEAKQRKPPTRLLAAFGDPVSQPSQVAQNSTTTTLASGLVRWRSAIRDVKPKRDSFDASAIPQLFYAARELANLRELAGDNAMVLSDVSATRDSLLKTDLAPYAMLHLATHGRFDPEKPDDSGLLLSTINRDGQPIDGFVRLEDIYQLRAPVQLVVLSACDTALGKYVQGEGIVGVTRGFMYAGASSVVASLWKVDDAATAELMKQFYTNMLHEGMNPGEALRAAQNSIRQRPNWQSPYYWAAFTLQGEYSQVIKPIPAAPSSVFVLRWEVGVGIMLILILGSLAVWYRQRRTVSN